MIDLRRVALIFVIAVLYAILVNALIAAFYPTPKYEDYCTTGTRYYPEKPYAATPAAQPITCPSYDEPAQADLDQCAKDKGFPDYTRDANSCPLAYKGCNFCQRDYDKANQKYNYTFFILSSILAVIAIGIGLALPTRQSLNEWIATGFMLGGLITLFFGTFRYYEYLGRYVKPIVIFAELVLIILLSYKKLKDISPKAEKQKKLVK